MYDLAHQIVNIILRDLSGRSGFEVLDDDEVVEALYDDLIQLTQQLLDQNGKRD